MRNDYEMVTLASYVERYAAKCVDLTEKEIEKQVEKYLINQQRNNTNAKVVEALLG